MADGLKGVEILHEVPYFSGGDFLPPLDDTYDLGSAAQAWQDGHFDGIVYTDVIAEHGSGVGVTIDGVLLKDSQPYCDVINEKTTATGVTVDGVLLKDSYISLAEATLPAATVVYIGRDNSGDITVNVLTGKTFHVAVAGVDALDVALGTITIAQSLIDHNPAALSGTPSTTGCWFDQAAQTFTDSATAASGTAAAMVFNAFQQPTLAASNTGVTTTWAATVYIPGPPLAGTNQTITYATSLLIDHDMSVSANRAIFIRYKNFAASQRVIRIGDNVDGGGYLMLKTGASAGSWDLMGAVSVRISEGAGIGFVAVTATTTDIVSRNGNITLSPTSGAVAILGGSVLKSSSATEIGLQVSNGALTLGSEGSIEIPYLSQTGALFTDAIGGNLDGCIGVNYDSDTGPTATFEARVEGAWLSVALAGIGIQSKVPYHPNTAWVHPNQIYQTEGRQWINETICVVCGEKLRKGEPALPWVNIANNGVGDMHSIFGHMHLEKDEYIKQLEARIVALEGRN